MLSQGAFLHSHDNPWPLEKETYGLLDLRGWGEGRESQTEGRQDHWELRMQRAKESAL